MQAYLTELLAADCSPLTLRPYAVDLLESNQPGYAPATINHRLSVVAGFYHHHARLGAGPAANPVPKDGPRKPPT